jgi:hypothetical protein
MKPLLRSDEVRRAEIWGLALAMGLQISEQTYEQRKADMLRQCRAQLEFERPDVAPNIIDDLLRQFTHTALLQCEALLNQLDA